MMPEPAREAYGMLRKAGYDHKVTSALIGNIMQESAFNTNAVGDNGNAYGIAQWNGPRRRAYAKYARENNLHPEELQSQINFLVHELRGPENRAYQRIQNAPDARTAALEASRHFWRPGVPHNENRVRYAAAADKAFAGQEQPRRWKEMFQNSTDQQSAEPSQPTEQSQPQGDRKWREMFQSGAEKSPPQVESPQESLPPKSPAVSATPDGPGGILPIRQTVAGNADARAQMAAAEPQEQGLSFVDRLTTAAGTLVNDVNSGLQGVNPIAAQKAPFVGVIRGEGDSAHVLITDDGAGQKMSLDKFPKDKFFTQLDPESGETLVFERVPDAEDPALASVGRIVGMGASSTIPAATAALKGAKGTSESALAMQAMERQGITPSLGMTSPAAGRVASAGDGFMLTSGRIKKDAERAVGEIDQARERIAAGVGAAEDAVGGGQALFDGADNFVSKNLRNAQGTARAQRLWGKVDRYIPQNTQMDVGATVAALQEFTERFKDTPHIAQTLGSNRWQGFLADIAQNNGKLTWDQARRLRSELGSAIGNMKGPLNDASEAQVKAIYKSLSEDLAGAAKAAGPKAERAWEIANAVEARYQKTVEEALDIVFKAKSPEAAFEGVLAIGRERGKSANIGKLARIKDALPKEQWARVSSAVIRRMGTQGDDFSPDRFLTEWNKLSSKAKSVLFSGKGAPDGLRRDLDDLVRVVETSKGARKLLNHSNSGSNVTNVAAAAALGSVAADMSLISGVLVAAGVTTGLGMARLITNPAALRLLRGYVASGGAPGKARQLSNWIQRNPEVLMAANEARVANGSGQSSPPQLPPPTRAPLRLEN